MPPLNHVSCTPTLAGVAIPDLMLQIAQQQFPEYQADPLVVVPHDRPSAPILEANALARAHHITPGLSFTRARTITPKLRAVTLSPDDVERAGQQILACLMQYSPTVQPVPQYRGFFWIDPTGFERLYGSQQEWGNALLNALNDQKLSGTLVIGFYRYSIFALAHTKQHLYLSQSPEQERSQAALIPLNQLPIPHECNRSMALLGVRTLGEFAQLPHHQVALRYSNEVQTLHRYFNDTTEQPLQPHSLNKPLERSHSVVPPTACRNQLLFHIKQHMHPLLDSIARTCEALTQLIIRFEQEHADVITATVITARPTVSPRPVLDLIRLKLLSIEFSAPVETIHFQAFSSPNQAEQLNLFSDMPHRHIERANEAISRIRSLFGEQAVSTGQCIDAYLPEAQFFWKPLAPIQTPKPPKAPPQPTVVRLYKSRPIPIPPRPSSQSKPWYTPFGIIEKGWGPYRISGRWWSRPITRDYHYGMTQHKHLLNLYYDHYRNQWFLCGTVE